jgi:hypothetical protein
MSRVLSETEPKHLSLSSMDVVKGDVKVKKGEGLRLDGDGLTACHVCSIPHS